MIPGVTPTITSANSGGMEPFPVVTITVEDIQSYGYYYGYILQGGVYADLMEGYGGGSITASLATGLVTDAVIGFTSTFPPIMSMTTVVFQGNYVAELSGITAVIIDDGVPIPLDEPFEYGEVAPGIYGTVGIYSFAWGADDVGDHTIQLIEGE